MAAEPEVPRRALPSPAAISRLPSPAPSPHLAALAERTLLSQLVSPAPLNGMDACPVPAQLSVSRNPTRRRNWRPNPPTDADGSDRAEATSCANLGDVPTQGYQGGGTKCAVPSTPAPHPTTNRNPPSTTKPVPGTPAPVAALYRALIERREQRGRAADGRDDQRASGAEKEPARQSSLCGGFQDWSTNAADGGCGRLPFGTCSGGATGPGVHGLQPSRVEPISEEHAEARPLARREVMLNEREAMLHKREAAVQRLHDQLEADFEFVLVQLEGRLDSKKAQLSDEQGALRALQERLDARERDLQGREQTARLLLDAGATGGRFGLRPRGGTDDDLAVQSADVAALEQFEEAARKLTASTAGAERASTAPSALVADEPNLPAERVASANLALASPGAGAPIERVLTLLEEVSSQLIQDTVGG